MRRRSHAKRRVPATQAMTAAVATSMPGSTVSFRRSSRAAKPIVTALPRPAKHQNAGEERSPARTAPNSAVASGRSPTKTMAWAAVTSRNASAVSSGNGVVLAPGNVFSLSQGASDDMRFNVAQCADKRVFDVLEKAMEG